MISGHFRQTKARISHVKYTDFHTMMYIAKLKSKVIPISPTFLIFDSDPHSALTANLFPSDFQPEITLDICPPRGQHGHPHKNP